MYGYGYGIGGLILLFCAPHLLYGLKVLLLWRSCLWLSITLLKSYGISFYDSLNTSNKSFAILASSSDAKNEIDYPNAPARPWINILSYQYDQYDEHNLQ